MGTKLTERTETRPDGLGIARRLTRRRLALAAPAGLASLALLGMGASARQERGAADRAGDVPTTGGSRPGPMGLDAGPVAKKVGARPVALTIDKLAIVADVEILNIVDGAMQNPTGPFVVSWYEETGGAGALGNIVIAGHVDYWSVGPAVFYNIYWGEQLAEGDQITVTAEDGETYTYAVSFQQLYSVTDLTPEIITDLIFPRSKEELVTLITCGGEFDPVSGEYNSRVIVRGERVKL